MSKKTEKGGKNVKTGDEKVKKSDRKKRQRTLRLNAALVVYVILNILINI